MKGLRRHHLTLAGILLVALAFMVPLVFPVYFRDDDVFYIQWARTHVFLDCFIPSQATLFGMFRPVQNITWWILFHTSGLNAYPYQVVLTLTYLIGFVCYMGFVATALSRPVAWLTMGAYLVGFHFLMYVIFWFSDLTYTLEIMLAHASLWCLAATVKSFSWLRLTAGLTLFIGAVMAKEPAAIMLPSVFAFLVFLKRNSMDKRLWYRFAAIALLMLAAGAAWVILNPALQGRQGIPNESMAVILKSFILPRWNFYAAALTTPSSLIVLVATLFLVFQHLLKSRIKSPIQIICLSLLAALCAAFLLKMAPAIALATLITSMTLLLLVSHPAGLGTAGTIPAILGLMTISYVIRTYLVEASFGLALICGLALNECRLALPLRGMSKASGRMKSVIALAMTALAAFGLLIITPSLSEKISALRLLCANRQTLSMTLDYLKKSPPLPGPLLVIDYTDMGLLYERDILPMDDRSKAARQKTMSSFSMNAFLQPILGMPVRNFSSWRTNDFEHAVAVVLTMNPSEETFLEKLPLHAEKLREWIQGDARAALYRIDRLASGGN